MTEDNALQPQGAFVPTEGLSDLIATLEKAEAGSQELDRAIYIALRPTDNADELKRLFSADGAGFWFWVSDSSYTTSIDAALALAERVLPDAMWGFQQNVTHPDHPDVLPFSAWTGRTEAMGRSFPLALCIAILRARVANTPTPSHGRDEAKRSAVKDSPPASREG